LRTISCIFRTIPSMFCPTKKKTSSTGSSSKRTYGLPYSLWHEARPPVPAEGALLLSDERPNVQLSMLHRTVRRGTIVRILVHLLRRVCGCTGQVRRKTTYPVEVEEDFTNRKAIHGIEFGGGGGQKYQHW
jgi:hypothetical protein